MRTLDVVVAVPGARVELHKAHALLHQLAREQALAAKGIRRVLADAIGCFLFFASSFSRSMTPGTCTCMRKASS